MQIKKADVLATTLLGRVVWATTLCNSCLDTNSQSIQNQLCFKNTLLKLLTMNPKVKTIVFLLIAVAITLAGVSCTIIKHFQKSSTAILCRLSEQMLASALQVDDANSWNLLRFCMAAQINFCQLTYFMPETMLVTNLIFGRPR